MTSSIDPKTRLPEFFAACERNGIAPTKFLFWVNIGEQTATVFEDGKFFRKYTCSTSRFGIGEVSGSNMTPRGLHRIAEKIGDGCPAGTVFKERKIVGYTFEGYPEALITTRIMWLEGLEPGFNRGGNVDSHDRYIYIHGTGNQAGIGKPASHGCVHLSDPDLIELFNLLPSGTLVWISEK